LGLNEELIFITATWWVRCWW